MKRKNCDVCGRVNKEDGNRFDRWESWVVLMPFKEEISVCPLCREKSFNKCVYDTLTRCYMRRYNPKEYKALKTLMKAVK